MKAYVINLRNRVDRWQAVSNQWVGRSQTLIRIDAINSADVLPSQTDFLPAPVVANWMSQCKVYKEFLDSKDQYALVLEDDCILGDADLAFLQNLAEECNLDFLQLGYLYNSSIDYFMIKVTNLRDFSLKVLSKISLILKSRYSQKLLLKEQKDIKFSIVLNHAGAGSHAYIVSRKFAEEMVKINIPMFLATDGLFIAISGLRFLRMGRLRRNLIKQSNSPSSITKRFVN